MQVIANVKKAQKGDKEAFVWLIELHKEYMYKIACAYLKNDTDCADAIQDTILSMYEKIYTLKKPRYFKTWMTKILINKCNDMLKTKKSIMLIKDYIENNQPFEITKATDDIEFRSIIDPLKQKHKIVLLLYYLENYPINEIARMTGVAPGTVKSRLYRGREEFKKLHLKNESIHNEEVCYE